MIASILALLPFALFAAASPSQCDTGAIKCCNNSTTYDSEVAQTIFAKYNLVGVAAIVDAVVGLECSPVTVIGTSKSCSANQQPLCCEDNKYNGAVNLGCSPINLDL
ncbi:fungal hydrophobin [Suillus ampliporus]|nr:fungal hydrophobin [Suillus ampliporus]